MKPSVELSVVTTLYCSSPYVAEFYRRATAAAQALTTDYEIILVNDGSPDDGLAVVIAFQRQDPHVVIVDLSRNFGHHKALLTGLSYARGNHIFLIDSDLEEDPEWLLPFHETLRSRNSDVVYGVQERRKGAIFERFTGWLFYTLFNYLTNTPLPFDATTARLMTRRYVDSLLRYQEREIFVHGLWPHAGYLQIPIKVTKRSKGITTYTFARKISLVVDAITSFSNKPLVFIFYTGLLLSLGAGSYIVWLLQLRLFHSIPLTGWASLIVSIWFLGGLTILFIGVLGIYLAKVFSETKQRPRAIVRQVLPASRENARSTAP